MSPQNILGLVLKLRASSNLCKVRVSQCSMMKAPRRRQGRQVHVVVCLWCPPCPGELAKHAPLKAGLTQRLSHLRKWGKIHTICGTWSIFRFSPGGLGQVCYGGTPLQLVPSATPFAWPGPNPGPTSCSVSSLFKSTTILPLFLHSGISVKNFEIIITHCKIHPS